MTVPALSYTYTICPFGLQKFQCVLLPNLIHWNSNKYSLLLLLPQFSHIFNSGYRINSLWITRICASILLGIQWTMGNVHLDRWWQTITITLILGYIACLVMGFHEDLFMATSRIRGYMIWKWVKIVKRTCDREWGFDERRVLWRAGKVCGKAGSWVKREAGRSSMAQAISLSLRYQDRALLHGGFPPWADHQHSILLFHIFDLEASSGKRQLQGTNERCHLEHRARLIGWWKGREKWQELEPTKFVAVVSIATSSSAIQRVRASVVSSTMVAILM